MLNILIKLSNYKATICYYLGCQLIFVTLLSFTFIWNILIIEYVLVSSNITLFSGNIMIINLELWEWAWIGFRELPKNVGIIASTSNIWSYRLYLRKVSLFYYF